MTHTHSAFKTVVFLSCIFLGSLGQVASDMYLPSLPHIAVALQAPISLVQLSMTAYMCGFIFQFIYGLVSDAVGRRKPLIVGVFILFIGSLVCYQANSITSLIVGRFLQGLGAGMAFLTRSIVRDVYEGLSLAKIGSYLAMTSVTLMAGAPLIGGYIQHFFTWQANFLVLLGYSGIMFLLALLFFPETNQSISSHHLKFKQVIINLKTLFGCKTFIGYSLTTFGAYGSWVTWFTAGSVILQNAVGLSAADFGVFAGISGACYMLGTFVNIKIIDKLGIYRATYLGAGLMVLAGLLSALSYYVMGVTLWAVVLPGLLFGFGTGFVFANAFSGALTHFPTIAGLAGAMYGTIQISSAILYTIGVAYSHEDTQWPLAIAFLLSGCIAISALRFLVKRPA